MKNKLTDLNDHLFSQLERLGDESIKGEELAQEIDRSSAIIGISKSVISNATLQLDALKLKGEYQGLKKDDIPVQLIGVNNASS